MSHTPGPWEARPADGQVVLNGSNCYDIQEIYNDQGGFNPDDIRLMAAAPDMLAALKSAMGTIQYLLANSDNGPAENCLELLAAAIAKAEGRE